MPESPGGPGAADAASGRTGRARTTGRLGVPRGRRGEPEAGPADGGLQPGAGTSVGRALSDAASAEASPADVGSADPPRQDRPGRTPMAAASYYGPGGEPQAARSAAAARPGADTARSAGILAADAPRRYSWEDGPAGRPEAGEPPAATATTANAAAAPAPGRGDDARGGGHRAGRDAAHAAAARGGAHDALPLSRLVGLLLAAAVVAVCVLAYQWTGSAARAVPDSYYPVQQALHFAGRGGDLHAQAAGVVCHEASPHGASGAAAAACRRNVDAAAAWPSLHRRLLQMQPGFAVIAAPFVAVLGTSGIPAAAFLIGVACGVLCLVAFRAFGVGAVRGLLASALFLVLPTGVLVTRIDGHGAAMLGILLALAGVGHLVRARRAPAAFVCLGVGLIWALVARFADGLAFALCLALAMAVLAVTRDRARRVRMAAGAVLSVGIMLVWAAFAYLLGLPGVRDAVMDGLTGHFVRPSLSDPLGAVAHGDRVLLSGWLHGPHTQAVVLLAGGVALIALIARFRSVTLIWCAPAVAALLVVLARPDAAETAELGALVWLPIALGLAHALDIRGLRRLRYRRGEDARPHDAVDRGAAGSGTAGGGTEAAIRTGAGG